MSSKKAISLRHLSSDGIDSRPIYMSINIIGLVQLVGGDTF